jgi:pimeloyl-ACP methyl ester carboxylesterase
MAIETIVFVPGICGSVLKHGNETIWPGSPWNVAFGSYPEPHVDLLATSDQIKATDVLRSVPLKVLGVTLHHFNGYQHAFDALEGMGFQETGGTLIPFPYDWRQDMRRSAQALKDRLGQDDLAGRTIAIVAHSMGGLVARYMLEKLGAPGSVRIELCALVAVPHLGAPVVLQNILGLRPEIFLSSRQCREVLRNSAYPSAYQLLPRLGVPALMEVAAGIGFDVRDPYNRDVGQRLGLVNGSVDAARELGADLDYMAPGFKPPCRYVAIAGNSQKTTTANYIEASSARAVEEITAGDGTVPLWSAAPPGLPVRYVAATHAGMFSDSDTRAMLQAVLRPGMPGGRTFNLEPSVALPMLSVQVVDASVEVGKPFTVALAADRPTGEVDAVLEVERLFETRRDTQEVPLRYTGGPLRSLSVDLVAPTEPAVLQFCVRSTGTQLPGREATVLVVAK